MEMSDKYFLKIRQELAELGFEKTPDEVRNMPEATEVIATGLKNKDKILAIMNFLIREVDARNVLPGDIEAFHGLLEESMGKSLTKKEAFAITSLITIFGDMSESHG